jgi:hypothetical protein
MLQEAWLPSTYAARGTVYNCSNEEDSKSIAYGDDNGDLDSGKLFFTPGQHKALLALLQGSNNVQSHSVNHITTQPSSSTGIICALPSLSNIDDTFILDTGATDHLSVFKLFSMHEEN